MLMGKAGAGNDRLSTLLHLAQGKKPDMDTVMQMAMENRKHKFVGFAPIADIAPCEIMGKLTKWFLSGR